MIRVVMLDLGETLAGGSPLQVFPHVPEALTAIRGLTTPTGEPIAVCLVSDFTPTPAEVAAAFNQYVGLLTNLGLKSHFEPVAKRVTISAHTATWKPDRRVFEVAIQRLGIQAELHECLLITENPGHIAAARNYGMVALQFGVDFTDWSEAHALVATRVAEAAWVGEPEPEWGDI